MWSSKTDENHLSQKFILSEVDRRIYREKNPVPSTPFLPEPKPEDANKILLVLDLDETLIHGSYAVPPRYDFSFKLELPKSKRIKTVYVQTRPYLGDFLETACQWFEMVVYTASLSIYADSILDKIDPNGFVKHRLYRQHCAMFKEYYVKDLEFLGRPLNRVLLIDNHPASYMAHRDNGVPIYSYFGQPEDTGLKDLLTFLDDIRSDDDIVGRARKYAVRWRKKLKEFVESSWETNRLSNFSTPRLDC